MSRPRNDRVRAGRTLREIINVLEQKILPTWKAPAREFVGGQSVPARFELQPENSWEAWYDLGQQMTEVAEIAQLFAAWAYRKSEEVRSR